MQRQSLSSFGLTDLLFYVLVLMALAFGTPAMANAATVSLDPTRLNFGADAYGKSTDPQTFTIENTGTQAVTLSAQGTGSWMSYSPQDCAFGGLVTVSVNASGLASGNYCETISVWNANSGASAKVVEIRLNVYEQGQTNSPFGSFETPVDGSTVSGSIPVTGWVLDDIGVESLQIYRAPTGGEGSANIFIGHAYMVEGARPDVQALYPDYPGNSRAGWGYMLLTNGLPQGGNGTYTLYAIATDKEGNAVTLGSKTITSDNANAVKPFGSIDSPIMGGVASGPGYVNFGWVLTPQPNTIPQDGSTIWVWIDGLRVGQPVYNQYRQDIADLFPGYNNSNGAGGYFIFDTTQYADGVHTIAWSATDDAGNTEGIGSRYFQIQNRPAEVSGCSQGSGGAL